MAGAREQLRCHGMFRPSSRIIGIYLLIIRLLCATLRINGGGIFKIAEITRREAGFPVRCTAKLLRLSPVLHSMGVRAHHDDTHADEDRLREQSTKAAIVLQFILAQRAHGALHRHRRAGYARCPLRAIRHPVQATTPRAQPLVGFQR
jgi:hypothetical protein